eukprot:8174731-Ditylum_brightwellii.AAC.1
MIHLLSGYDQALDCKFRGYISDKKVSFEEGQQITLKALMTYALNYYNVRKNCKLWGQKAAEEQIVTLTSTIKELRDANLQLAKSLAGMIKRTVNTKRKEACPPNNKKNNAKKKANNSNWYPRLVDISKDDPTYGWIVLPTKAGEPKTKTVGGATYCFCPNHANKGAW